MRKRDTSEEETLRNTLKNRRLELGMTQRELSKFLNTPHTFINKYETGERFLTFTEVLNICKHLDLDVHKVVDVVGDSTKL